MKGFVNLPALSPANGPLLAVVEVAPDARKERTRMARVRRSVAASQVQKRPTPKSQCRREHKFTAPHAFVAACYANTWEGRTRTVGRQMDIKA